MKILYLEDHTFFAKEIVDHLRDDLKHEVVFADSWKSVKEVLDSGEVFEVSILDVILTNGKTGFHVAKTWEPQLGRIVFLTGCTDDATLKALEEYPTLSKLNSVWESLDEFLEERKN